MNRKLIGVLIIILGIVIIAGIIYILFINQNLVRDTINQGVLRKEAATEDNKKTQTQTTESGHTTITTPIKKANISIEEIQEPAPRRDVGEEMLIQMAGTFAERFGSYSNQSNFNNITDLTMFMSKRMQRWADNYVSEKRNQGTTNDIYYGITTKAVGETVRSYNDSLGHANIMVRTRRREATGTTYNISDDFDQDILITFKKENGIWKVDAAYWQE